MDKDIVALGDCPRVPPSVTIVTHVMYGAITMSVAELLNCISRSSRLKIFKRGNFHMIEILKNILYLNIINFFQSHRKFNWIRTHYYNEQYGANVSCTADF